MKIKLGATYRDVVTGFVGVATGYVKYITGCNQALLVPRHKSGVRESSRWYDEQRLKRVGRKIIKLPQEKGTAPGFDMEPPKEGTDDDNVSPDERG